MTPAPRPPYARWLRDSAPHLTWNWPHLAYLWPFLDRFIERRIDRLLIHMPPRHGKSEGVTTRLPAHLLEHDPRHRIILGAHSQPLASKFSRRARRIARDRGVQLNPERKAADDWETAAEGGVRAAGVGVGIAGFGADTAVIDDPVRNRAEANSPAYREHVWDWFTDDFYTRLEPGGAIAIIMTRWHPDDLGGRCIEQFGTVEDGGEWTVVSLPALAEPGDPLGRAEGEALCPDRYDRETLLRIKAVLQDSFFALYQQRPVSAAGAIVRWEWLRYYASAPAGPSAEIVQSWDTAQKKGETNSYSACTTWAVTRQAVYLLEAWRDRLDYPDLKRAVRSKATQWRPSAILIEDKSSGSSLIQELRRDTSLRVVAVEPEGDKETRMRVEASAYQAGQVLHPKLAPWLADYESELTSFPAVKFPDWSDSTSQLLHWWRLRSHSGRVATAGRRIT